MIGPLVPNEKIALPFSPHQPVLVEKCPFSKLETQYFVQGIYENIEARSFIFGSRIQIDKWNIEVEKQITCITFDKNRIHCVQ